MSIWGQIKNAAGDVLSSAVDEVQDIGTGYVSNIWGGSSPGQEEKANSSEVVASIPNAVPSDQSGMGIKKPINWQAVAAVASAAAVVVMIVRSR